MRPMLAPNLYAVMRHMRNRVEGPIRLFEIGSCYRKESRSSSHMAEFTMLNLVELGPQGEPLNVLKDHIAKIMSTIDLNYSLCECESDVYRSTLDVEVNGHEVASGAVGPHYLDKMHDINEPWCGAGFGLERLLMIKNKKDNIKTVGRNLVYLNGIRIDI